MSVIQLKRGTQTNALAASLQTGEPVFCTDTGLLLVYDGSEKKVINSVITGLYSAMPAAEIEGRCYFATDTGQLYQDNGVIWQKVILGADFDQEVLENIEIMMAWDVYTGDSRFDDVLIEDFADETFIDTANSTYSYNATDDYCTNKAACTGNATDVDITAESQVELENLFGGDTIYWQATGGGGTTGCFSSDSAGTTRLTIKEVGSDYPDIEEGVRIVHAGGEAVIVVVINDGDQDDEVEIDTAITDATEITGAYGLEVVDSDDLQVTQTGADGSQNSGTDYATADMTSHTTPSPNVVSASSETSAAGRYAWKAFNRTNADGEDSWETTDASLPDWLKFYYGSGNGKVINKYRILCRNYPNPRRFPRNFRLQGSNNDSDWDDLDTREDIDDPGQNTWSQYFTFQNNKSYEYYRLYITDANNGGDGRVNVGQLHLVEASLVTAAIASIAYTKSALQLDTSSWSHIEDITATQTTPGSSTAYYAATLNMGETTEEWWVYLSSTWRGIVRNNSGTWQYKNSGGTYTNATVNSRLGAFKEAFVVSENQMDAAGLSAITEGQWDTRLADGTNNDTLDFAVGLQASGNDIPTLDKITVTYSTPAEDMDLRLEGWEATADNPDSAYALLKIKDNTAGITLGTDFKAFTSMDDGANFEELATYETIQTIGDFDFVRAEKAGLTARSDKTMVLRVRLYGSKDVELHAASLGVSYES